MDMKDVTIYKIRLDIRLNSHAPGICGHDFKSVIFRFMFRIEFLCTSSEIAYMYMPHTIDEQSTLVQVTDQCSQAISHYFS